MPSLIIVQFTKPKESTDCCTIMADSLSSLSPRNVSAEVVLSTLDAMTGGARFGGVPALAKGSSTSGTVGDAVASVAAIRGWLEDMRRDPGELETLVAVGGLTVKKSGTAHSGDSSEGSDASGSGSLSTPSSLSPRGSDADPFNDDPSPRGVRLRVGTADGKLDGSAKLAHTGLTRVRAESGGLNTLLRSADDAVRLLGSPRPMADVLADINSTFKSLCEDVLLRNGHEVVYAMIRPHPAWKRILLHVAQLAYATESPKMDPLHRKASLYNLYNVLIFHAKLVFGHPTTLAKRGKFFRSAAYVICGTHVNSVDLEHAILRCKAEASSPLYRFRLEQKDPRMHFVLNCGARSCPPIRPLSNETVEKDLQEATIYFTNKEVGIRYGEPSPAWIDLSRLFKWFRNDFTPGSFRDAALTAWIAANSDTELSRKMQSLTKNISEDPKQVKIKFSKYDWQDNGDWSAPPDDGLMFVYDASFAKER